MSSAVEIDRALRDAGVYDTPRVTKGDAYYLTGIGDVTVLDGSLDTEDDSWGEDAYSAWAVFEAAGRTFRKTGYGDSWGAFSWDGALIEVVAEKVEKVEYVEYVPPAAPELNGKAIEAWVAENASEGWYELYDIDTPWGALKVLEASEWGEGNTGPIHYIFSLGSKTWKKTGNYQSWVGTEWSDAPYEVVGKPVQKIEYVRA